LNKVGRCVSPRQQKPHRPGIAPALGLRAKRAAAASCCNEGIFEKKSLLT
jgi:hypothetical protein